MVIVEVAPNTLLEIASINVNEIIKHITRKFNRIRQPERKFSFHLDSRQLSNLPLKNMEFLYCILTREIRK